MDAYLALSARERRDYCAAAADRSGLDAPSIEKDFWGLLDTARTFCPAGHRPAPDLQGRHLAVQGLEVNPEIFRRR